jgi:rhodanese-related sulfurtransferase
MKSITVAELKEKMDQNEDFQLIDVREPSEYAVCEIGGQLIPMNTIPNHIEEISKEKMVVVHCRSGKRSANVITYLEQNHGYTNLYNLEGGILAWADEIDDSVPRY